MPTALVTGASGFLGSHLCMALTEAGWEVIALVRKPLLSRIDGVRPLIGDIFSIASSGELVDRLDAIFHFAAAIPRAGAASYERLMTVNAAGTAAMLDVYDRSRAGVFVYASGLPVIGKPHCLPISEIHPVEPLTPYHASKYAGEVACMEYERRTKRRVVAFRITAPYGPGMPDSVLPRFVSAASEDRTLSIYGSGARVQNFVWAGDVAKACVSATRKGNGCFNLGGPSGTSMLALAKLACDIAGRDHSLIRTHCGTDPQEEYRFEVYTSLFVTEFGMNDRTDIRHGMEAYARFVESQERYHGWWI